jgi:hypothetical protein
VARGWWSRLARRQEERNGALMTLQTLTKQSFEERLFQYDFSELMSSTGTITIVTSIVPTNLGKVSGSSNISITTITFSGQVVQAMHVGGTSGETYKVTAKVVDSDGQRLELDGLLRVQDE